MNESDKKNAIINYFKQMITYWNCLNTSPTMNVLTLNCLDPEYEKIIAEEYRDCIIYESPVCYYFVIGGNYINLPKNDTASN
jgi:hypothetical protein